MDMPIIFQPYNRVKAEATFPLIEADSTESDIKEAARAFTGWSFKPNGDYVLRVSKHDTDSKTFLDENGNFGGDDIINIITKLDESLVIKAYCVDRFDRRCPVRFHFF